MALPVEERFINNLTGNGLFAKKDFTVGEVIFEERPLVSCQFAWNEDCGYKSCEYCLRPLESAQENARRLTGLPDLVLPFPEYDAIDKSLQETCDGCGITYCSPSCKDEAFRRYHQTMCHKKGQSHPLAVIRASWKEMHYPPESMNVMILAKLAAMFRQASEEERSALSKMLARFQSGFASANESFIHRMMGQQFQAQLETLRPLFAAAFPEMIFQDWWTRQNFLSLFTVFARNAQGVGVSSFGAWQYALRNSSTFTEDAKTFLDVTYVAINEKTGEEFIDNEGSGLYIMQRACNHSCDPNTEVSFLHNDSTLSLIARHPIKVGEEIFISYLDECTLKHSRHTRRKILRENYLFECQCRLCSQQADQADITSDEDGGEDDDWKSDDPMEEEEA
ncbi:hypothetical protein RvY_04741 [Ramazzottius varieornatus]|uniref:SET domain-containing protein n=1 Tax=Ramazzottius varieornatus TaxID=947166 RepID=A0A1D1UYA6_RAMVA|nr:hypothetical protein RvY_04741 [Ramazzottius varieornatus]